MDLEGKILDACANVMLVGCFALLTTIPGVMVAAVRYPLASEQQIMDNSGSLFLVQRVDELEEQQKSAKTYTATITIVSTYDVEIQALSKDHAYLRVAKHRGTFTRARNIKERTIDMSPLVEKIQVESE